MKEKKVLLLGSIAGIVPPTKQGGTENVVYVQAKELAKRGNSLLLIAGVGSEKAFKAKLLQENEADPEKILQHIEFNEIGGGTQVGNAAEAVKLDLSSVESSRLFRIELVNLTRVGEEMTKRQDEYSVILNNMRGGAIFIPLAKELKKPFINVMHLPLFQELADLFVPYTIPIVTLSNSQRKGFEKLYYLANIPNPVNIHTLSFNPTPENYALNISAIGEHKNQKDAILACKKAGIPLILAGKIRDNVYFEQEIKPYIDNKQVMYKGEVGFEEKKSLYQKAKVFLFPVKWQEPFGLVLIEAMSCGTPVIAYPNGGPAEIVKDGETGFLVNNVDEMARKITEIDQIDRMAVRADVEKRFSEEVVGVKYYSLLLPFLT